jgi:hypothetical protein
MTILHKDPQPSSWTPPSDKIIDLSDHGIVDDWCCVDCRVNTAPGTSTRAEVEEIYRRPDFDPANVGTISFSTDSEIYMVRPPVWKRAGMEGWGGCLCVGCLEQRIGRRLKPKDFDHDHIFNSPDLPRTERLWDRLGY